MMSRNEWVTGGSLPGQLSSTAPAPIIRGGWPSEQGGGTGRGEGEEGGGEENIVWLCQIRGKAQYL